MEDALKELEVKHKASQQVLRVKQNLLHIKVHRVDQIMLDDSQEKDALIAELNRELQASNVDRNEKNHNQQVLEKQLLKAKEDLDMLASKFEAFKDIELVSGQQLFFIDPIHFYIDLPSSSIKLFNFLIPRKKRTETCVTFADYARFS